MIIWNVKICNLEGFLQAIWIVWFERGLPTTRSTHCSQLFVASLFSNLFLEKNFNQLNKISSFSGGFVHDNQRRCVFFLSLLLLLILLIENGVEKDSVIHSINDKLLFKTHATLDLNNSPKHNAG